MSILITRPSPLGEELVNKLRSCGKFAWHLPMINFIKGNHLLHLPKHLTDLSKGDLLFIISQHAIDYADLVLKNNKMIWPSWLNYYAIGRSTAMKLHVLSQLPVVYPTTGESSEDLLRLPSLMHIKGKRALILCGNDGRKILAKTLLQRGLQVTHCECYRRIPIFYDGEEKGQFMSKLGINIIVVTSGEILQLLYALIPKSYHQTLLISCRLIVVSHRLATLARRFGWTDIIISGTADNDTLMRVLVSLS